MIHEQGIDVINIESEPEVMIQETDFTGENENQEIDDVINAAV